MTILSVKNLTKSYGKNKVLDDVSLLIEEPSLLGLVGPNGSGKSTFLNCISRIIAYEKGEVTFFGMPNTTPKIFEKISYMMDNAGIYPYLTGLDHLQFVSDSHKLPKTRLREAIDILGIGDFVQEKMGKYSLGMKQQLLITMALLQDPDLLIMDEPFNGLDPTTIIKVREIIKERFRRGKSTLLSSHNLSEIDRMTSHIVFVKRGKLIEEDISRYREKQYTVQVEDAAAVRDLNPDIFDLTEGVRFHTGDVSLQDALTLIGRRTEIASIDQVHLGAERRYMELFADEIRLSERKTAERS